jgi:hypothetical protein
MRGCPLGVLPRARRPNGMICVRSCVSHATGQRPERPMSEPVSVPVGDLVRGCQTVLPRKLSVQGCYPAHITLAECQRAWTLGWSRQAGKVAM